VSDLATGSALVLGSALVRWTTFVWTIRIAGHHEKIAASSRQRLGKHANLVTTSLLNAE